MQRKKGIEVIPKLKEAQNTKLLLFPIDEENAAIKDIRQIKMNLRLIKSFFLLNFDFIRLKRPIITGVNMVSINKYLNALLE